MSSDKEDEGDPPKIYIGGPEDGKYHEFNDGEISPLVGRYAKLQQHWNKMSNASPKSKNRGEGFGDERAENEKDSLLRTDDSLLEQELKQSKSDIISDVSSDLVS